jgi:peroxiredoxin Q/BCP
VVTVQPAIEEDDESKVEEDVLSIGGSLPSVTLKDDKGEDVETATLYKETGVVIFAAPKADTRKPPRFM